MFKVRARSWHWKFMSFFYNMNPHRPPNFCTYWWKLVFACTVSFVFAFLISIYVVSLLSGVYFFFGSIFGFVEPLVEDTLRTSSAALFFSHLIILFISSFIYILYKLGQITTNKISGIETEPGLIATKYRSWKDKYCPMIEVVVDENK